ncbi:MAG TPA: hypothetical protein VGQ83_34130 [Polyangia bacterium]
MVDADAPAPAHDRSLPLRTALAAVLGAGAGVALAFALVQALASIAMPAFGRYLHTAAFDANLNALSHWVGGASARRTSIIALCTAGGAVLVMPFLINRRLVRRLLSLVGLLRLVGAVALVGVVELLVLATSDLFAATSIALSDTGSFGLPAGGGVRAWGPLVLRIVLTAVGTAALFAVVGERETDGAAPGKGRGGGAALEAVGGLFAGALIALLAAWVRPRFGQLFNLDLIAAFGGSGEVSALGFERLRQALAVALGLLGASSCALLVALAPSPRSGKGRLGSLLLAALPAAVLALVALWFQGHCRDVRELRFPTLAAAAGLERAPAPRLLALPGAAGPRAFAWPMEATATGVASDERVGATRRNLSLLRAYVERQPRWTVHTQKAWGAQSQILDRLLEPEEAVRTQVAAAEATGSILEAALLAARLKRMPLTPAVKPVAERLLDPARYRARGEGKANLAEVALNLGDLARAQRLWGEAVTEGAPANPGRIPAALVPADGAITGLVRLAGAPVLGLRVALYSAAAPLDRVPNGVRLLAATTTDREGRFSFGGLPRSGYAVGLLLPESVGADPAGVEVGGTLGPFDLAKGPAQVDAGVITAGRRGAPAPASAAASAPASASASRPASAPASAAVAATQPAPARVPR